MKAVIQTMDWFNWLEEDDDDEEEYEEESSTKSKLLQVMLEPTKTNVLYRLLQQRLCRLTCSSSLI